MQVRDITTKPEWWEAYSLTIPVLTFSRDNSDTEVDQPLANSKTFHHCASLTHAHINLWQ